MIFLWRFFQDSQGMLKRTFRIPSPIQVEAALGVNIV
jgi:hypothetical protein